LGERPIGNLSGGERQKLLLARALVQDAPVILLDEPLNHLDIKNRAFTLELLREEHRRGRTVVAVMHDLREVRASFRDVIFLKEGRVIFSGGAEQAFQADLLREVFEVEHFDL
jgi:iron complex transport system ATP-binding protein